MSSTTTVTPTSSVTGDDTTTASSSAVTLVTTMANNMANLTSNLTNNRTDLGSLFGEHEEEINKTNSSDHTYRSVLSHRSRLESNVLVPGTQLSSRLWRGKE